MSGRIQVLLVEDEPMLTVLYEDVLEGSEFEIVDLTNCNTEAIEVIRTAKPDFVLVDFRLADGECVPVIDLLKEEGIPFLVVSVCDRPNDPKMADAAWITKPVEPERLLAEIRRVLEET